MATTTTYTTLRVQLDIDLRDADNFTFTDEEKDEVVRSAIEDDPNCYIVSVDDSQTIVAEQARYYTPYEQTLEVAYDANEDGYPIRVPRSAWEQIGDEIIFDREYKSLPEGVTLYIYGVEHLVRTSQIPSSLRGYIMANALVKCVDILMEGKVNRFLRNNTTMADMQMLRQNKLREADRLRPKLHNNRAVRF